jgi:hypothetical protein
MANSAGICSSFKTQLLTGLHNFGVGVVRAATTADTFKFALFLTSASIGPTTTTYSTTGELAATGNYTAGGVAVTNATPPALSGTTACWTPSASAVWSNLTSSGAFDTALLYNSTQSAAAVAAYALGSQSITAGTLTLTMPANTAGNALVQIA